MPRVEPPPCTWMLPDPRHAEPGDDVIGVGADLAPATLLAAYRMGLFPMHLDGGLLGWWSPDPRGVLPLDAMRVTRSLRQSAKHLRTSVDTAFVDVMHGCADRPDHERWINDDMLAAYTRLHEMGWAHSVEVWRGDALVGGLYGVEIGGLFAGESMFHRVRDASKVALLALVDHLRLAGGDRLVDVQWATDHLRTLGVIEVARPDYLNRLDEVLHTQPAFTG